MSEREDAIQGPSASQTPTLGFLVCLAGLLILVLERKLRPVEVIS